LHTNLDRLGLSELHINVYQDNFTVQFMELIILFVIVLVAGIPSVVAITQYQKNKTMETKFETLKKEESQKAAKQNIDRQMVDSKYKDAEEEARQIRESARVFYDKVKSQYKTQLDDINNKQKLFDTQQRDVQQREADLVKKQAEIAETRKQLLLSLEKTAGLSKADAQKQFQEEFQQSLIEYKATKISEVEKELRLVSTELSQQILIDAMQSSSIDYINEVTVSVIEIGSEEMKGKIIGRDGRNIRAFEKYSGVDVIIDESPTAIGLSSFDPVRREIARIALERLIKDKRIHPVTIEEQVTKAKKEMLVELEKAGKFIAEKASWYDVPTDLLPILGRMKYRASKGQNLYEHTMEVIAIAEYLAREFKVNVAFVQKAALLHDIGKVLTSKIKKPHHHISGDIARKYNMDPVIVNAIEAHHEDIESKSVEAEIIKIADKVSGARPGARKEKAEDYVERLESLEKVVFDLVGEKAEDIFAVRAGRELRVVVKPNQVSDDEAIVLAQEIATKIKSSGVFPGNVNIVVVREIRAHANTGNA